MITVLEERDFPISELYPLASSRSLGKSIQFKGKSYPVIDVETFDFSKADIGLFSAGAEVSAVFAPKAAAAGCVVIDNTSQFRYQDDIPLVVPEVNPHAIAQYRKHGIIANPNCSTIQMLVALKPLHDAAGIERINVATYQSVSGAGKEALDELAGQTAELLNGRPLESKAVDRQIAFNLLAQVGEVDDHGHAQLEKRLVAEIQQLLSLPGLPVAATCALVPVFFGDSLALGVYADSAIDISTVLQLLEVAPGIELVEVGDYPTAVGDAVGQDQVYVGRVRRGVSDPRQLNLWIASDNVRKGAALNAVQIAELLIKHYL
jgi:aspartate-semialdehyde dehydrogenase